MFFTEQLWPFILSHWELWASLLALILVIGGFELKTRAENAPALTTAMAVEWMNHKEAVVIDLRPQEAFNKGHIIHSHSILPENVVSAVTAEKNAKQYKNKPLLIVCAQGIQAQKTAAALKKAGIADVAILKGGINSWISAELPLEQGK